ncbi:MAG TPA: hypothetical protein DIU50_09625 [Acinetobacter nosocomialis]|nr:hypothetical protein [Acinetobacter nosocomialis]
MQFKQVDNPRGNPLKINGQIWIFAPLSEQIVDDGSLLIPLLKDGGAGFKKWGEEAKNAGAIMSKDMVNNLGKAKENLYTLELQFQGFQAMLINSVTPAVTAIAQNFDNIKAVV